MESKAKHPGGRPRKEIDPEELKRLLNAGHGLREIGRILKRGYGSVYRAAKDLPLAETDPKRPNVIQNPAE